MRLPLCTLFFLLTSAHLLSAQAGFKVYDYPDDAPVSPYYRVFVNGVETHVYFNPIGSIAIFEMDQPVTVEIECVNTVKYAIARPLSAEVKAEVADNRVTLKLDKPSQLSVEMNGLLREKLFIFAHSPKEKPRNTRNLQVFAAGRTHEVGLVWLESGDHVYIEGGAVVKGLFIIEDAEDVTIEGPGIIEASIYEEVKFSEGYRARVVQINDSRNVTLKDFLISDGRTWQVVPNRSEDITIDGIKIISDDGGDDGIDVLRSSNVVIRNCFIHTKDDCIAIKSHTADAQLRGTNNVLIENCIFWNTIWGNGFEIGFELRAEKIHDITLRDSDFIHVEKGAVLSIHNADWAVVENVLFADLRIEDARQKLFDYAIFWTWWSQDAPRQSQYEERYQQGGLWDNVMDFQPGEKELYARNRGHIRNIVARNIRIVDGGLPFSIVSGFDANHLVEDVLFEDIYLYDQKLVTKEALKLVEEYSRNIEVR